MKRTFITREPSCSSTSSASKQSKRDRKANTKADIREAKRLAFVSSLKVQQQPKTYFEMTALGAVKRDAHKSNWAFDVYIKR
jgi:hypothetical protein